MVNSTFKDMRIAFIGSAGIPNRYGGFESFLEHCGPHFSKATAATYVTCDRALYKDDLSENFSGVRRVFIGIRANGISSIFHDAAAFLAVFRNSTHIVVLGVSGGPWFPFFHLLCRIFGKKLAVNIDGVEWRRGKFSKNKQRILRAFDYLAQRFSDVVIYDNAGLKDYVIAPAQHRSVEIGYSGDHIQRRPELARSTKSALTICRIEPENNIDMLLDGAINSELDEYTIIGNWDNSDYGRSLRSQYGHSPRLRLLDPIYDASKLAELRERCGLYLHGHSVGGTNPSLVEMLYYDCHILCFDVPYNRVTAAEAAIYFRDSRELSDQINGLLRVPVAHYAESRKSLRVKYSGNAIADAYLIALAG